ncbi:CBS domain-containing protein [Candidatus Saccharibacteria bacterium]|nr:CBS domain-containing protein [Candidatus Saccharibacteria bacterium]
MLGWLVVVGLFGLSALLIILRKVYIDNPSSEPGKNPKSRSVKSTKREHVLSSFLLALSVSCFSIFAILVAEYLPGVAAFITIFIGLLFVFFIVPGLRAGGFSVGIANALSPLFISLLNRTKPYTKNLEKSLNTYTAKHTNYKRLNKSEIIEILNQQKTLSEGRTLSFELAGAIKSMNLVSKKVDNFMLKLDELHLVGDKESVGPILIDELHKSGRKIFLVNSSSHGIIGTVRLKDLIDLKDGGQVEEVYEHSVEFIDTDQDAREILELFAETGRTIFVVTDDDGEKIGAVYVEDVVKELVS